MEQKKPGSQIPFAHAVNFRELGGYQAADGRHVKWGVFFRGGCTDVLDNPEDRPLLESLGLKVVLDFRSGFEADERPDIQLPGVLNKRISAMIDPAEAEVDFSPEEMAEMFKEENLEKALMNGEFENGMAQLMYARLLLNNSAYRWMFEQILAENVPMLFHCTAGKDRTGMAAVLILLALGVPLETAEADYALTNDYRKEVIAGFVSQYAGIAQRHPELLPKLQAVEGVNPAMVRVALKAVLEKYGSVEAYFEAEYGLTAEKLALLRDKYLE